MFYVLLIKVSKGPNSFTHRTARCDQRFAQQQPLSPLVQGHTVKGWPRVQGHWAAQGPACPASPGVPHTRRLRAVHSPQCTGLVCRRMSARFFCGCNVHWASPQRFQGFRVSTPFCWSRVSIYLLQAVVLPAQRQVDLVHAQAAADAPQARHQLGSVLHRLRLLLQQLALCAPARTFARQCLL